MRTHSPLLPVATFMLIRPAILVAFLLCSTAAFAQKGTVAAVDTAEIRPFTAQDTVEAIHRLFESRRRGGGFLIGGSAAVAMGFEVAGASEPKRFLNPASGEIFFLTAFVTTPVWGFGIVRLIKFNSHREKLLVTNYQLTRKLPAFVQKRLRVKSARP